MKAAEPTARPLVRLHGEMRRLRIPKPSRETALCRLALYARAADLVQPPQSDAVMVSLAARIDALFTPRTTNRSWSTKFAATSTTTTI